MLVAFQQPQSQPNIKKNEVETEQHYVVYGPARITELVTADVRSKGFEVDSAEPIFDGDTLTLMVSYVPPAPPTPQEAALRALVQLGYSLDQAEQLVNLTALQQMPVQPFQPAQEATADRPSPALSLPSRKYKSRKVDEGGEDTSQQTQAKEAGLNTPMLTGGHGYTTKLTIKDLESEAVPGKTVSSWVRRTRTPVKELGPKAKAKMKNYAKELLDSHKKQPALEGDDERGISNSDVESTTTTQKGIEEYPASQEEKGTEVVAPSGVPFYHQ